MNPLRWRWVFVRLPQSVRWWLIARSTRRLAQAIEELPASAAQATEQMKILAPLLPEPDPRDGEPDGV